jgi:hypothetical protein
LAKRGKTPIKASTLAFIRNDILLGWRLYCEEKHLIGDNPTLLGVFKFPAIDFEVTVCL